MIINDNDRDIERKNTNMAPHYDSIEKHTTNSNGESAYRSGCSRCVELEQQLVDLQAKHSTKRACARWFKALRVPYTVEFFHEPKRFSGVIIMILSAVGLFMIGLAGLIEWIQHGTDFSAVTPVHYRLAAVFVLCALCFAAPMTKIERRDDNA